MEKYVCIKQKESIDCAAACVASICSYYGKNYSLEKIRDEVNVGKKGVSIAGIVNACKKLGFISKGVRYEGNVVPLLKNNPIIAHIQLGEQSHYVVVYEMKSDKVTIADPAEGLVSVSAQAFMDKWTRYAIILEPTFAFYNRMDERNNNINRVFELLLEYKKYLMLLVLLSFGVATFEIMGSFFFKGVIDYVLVKNSYRILITISLGILVINILKCVLEYTRNKLKIRFGRIIGKEVMKRYLRCLIRLPIGFFDKREAGDTINRFNDSFIIRELVSNVFVSVFFDGIIVAISIGLMGFSNYKITLVVLWALIHYIIIYSKYSGKIKDSSYKAKLHDADLAEGIITTVGGIETIKACQSEDFFEDNLKNKIDLLLDVIEDKDICVSKYIFLTHIMDAIVSIVSVSLLSVELLNSQITLGELVVFNLLLMCLLNSLKNIVGTISNIEEGFVAVDRVFELDYAMNDVGDVCDKWEDGDIIFDKVSFAYNNRNILTDFTLRIPQNSKIGIIGESGMGKTTIIKLLMGYYDTYEGNIKIGEKSIRNISKSQLCSNIFLIPQNTAIFKGTVYENIVMFNGNISRESVYKACRQAGLDKFLENNPEGIDYMLESSGKNISKGEAQRIALARFFIQKADVLILDEATCNLDANIEKKFMDTIYSIKDKTIIIISHNRENLIKCDNCIEINGNKSLFAS